MTQTSLCRITGFSCVNAFETNLGYIHIRSLYNQAVSHVDAFMCFTRSDGTDCDCQAPYPQK